MNAPLDPKLPPIAESSKFNLSAPFILRPIMTFLLACSIVIYGFISFYKLPVNDLPSIDYPAIGLHINYTGAAPSLMLDLVTIPIEKELTQIKGVKEISSVSYQGNSSVTLHLDFHTDIDDVLRQVEQRMGNLIKLLPSDIDEKPTPHKLNEQDSEVITLHITSDVMDAPALRTLADSILMPKLKRIKGVANVHAWGKKEELSIVADLKKMRARNITLQDLHEAIKSYSNRFPLGSIKNGTQELRLEINAKLNEANELGELVVAPGPIKLKEVATIEASPEQLSDFRISSFNKSSPAVILSLSKESGGNTVDISNTVKKMIPEFQSEMPPSVSLELFLNKSEWIEASIFDVEFSLFLATALVFGVIFFFLGGVREAIIVCMALPFSFLATFIAMNYLGFTLDLLSLLALTLAVGFVVDDAIVVLENIVRRQENGENRQNATLNGSAEIGFTILSMTLSLMAVFIPLLLMGGMNGRLFHEFSLTLALSILFSGIVSLTLTPALCARFLPEQQPKADHKRSNSYGWYIKSLDWCLNRKKSVLGAGFIALLLLIPLSKSLSIDLFPSEDRGYIWGYVRIPSGLTPIEMAHYQDKVESIVQNEKSIDSFLNIRFEKGIILLLKALPEHNRAAIEKISKDISIELQKIPGIAPHLKPMQLIEMERDYGGGGDLIYVIKGLEHPEVLAAAKIIKEALSQDPIFQSVELKNSQENEMVEILTDTVKIDRLGISQSAVQKSIEIAFRGVKTATMQIADKPIDINLELAKELKGTPATLQQLYVKKDQELIPLNSLISFKRKLADPNKRRLDLLPAIKIGFDPAEGISQDAALEHFKQKAAELLPPRVSGRFWGMAEIVSETKYQTALLLLAATLVMYLVLGILYESLIHPLTILSSLPLACLGGLFTLLIFGMPLSIYSIVGFLLLIGIVKKNGIMLVDFALERQKEGASPDSAIRDAARSRFRPIMMTTVAAVMGALPIAFGYGEGGQTRQGLGLVIAGGLIFSQMLTLYLTPALYLLLENIRKKDNAAFKGYS